MDANSLVSTDFNQQKENAQLVPLKPISLHGNHGARETGAIKPAERINKENKAILMQITPCNNQHVMPLFHPSCNLFRRKMLIIPSWLLSQIRNPTVQPLQSPCTWKKAIIYIFNFFTSSPLKPKVVYQKPFIQSYVSFKRKQASRIESNNR